MPPLFEWDILMDGVPIVPVTSGWGDARTLNLLLAPVTSAPAVVSVQWALPDPSYATAEHVPWPAYGPITCTPVPNYSK